MTRRHRKDAGPATKALAVPGLRVVVTGPDQALATTTTARTAAKAPAPGASTQHRKRRVKFVF